jgi:hypothetical protein
VLAAEPLSEQSPALFADIIKQLAESERHFQPISRPQYSGARHSESFIDAQQPPPPSLDHRSSFTSQHGTLQQSPQSISRAVDHAPAPRRDTLSSSGGSLSLSSAREVSDSSPSLPWLAPAAAWSAASLPSTAASPPALTAAFPGGSGDAYRPVREGAVELDAGAPPSCLVVPMPIDALRPREQPAAAAFQNPVGGAPTGYARMPTSNLPWNIRYTNFQGAGAMSDAPPAVPEKIPHGGAQGGAADGEKILGSQPGADEDKILGSPPDGEKMSPGPPPPPPRAAVGPVLWANASTSTLVPPPPATARGAEAARQVRRPVAHEMPEGLGVPPAGGHSRARARSVDATAGAGVSQVVLDRRRRRARHQILDDLRSMT